MCYLCGTYGSPGPTSSRYQPNRPASFLKSVQDRGGWARGSHSFWTVARSGSRIPAATWFWVCDPARSHQTAKTPPSICPSYDGGDGRTAAQYPRRPLLVDPLAGRIDEGVRLPEHVVEVLVVVVDDLAARAQIGGRLPGADLLAGPVGDLDVLARLDRTRLVEAVVPGARTRLAVGADGGGAVVEPARREVGDARAGPVLLGGRGGELGVRGRRTGDRQRPVLVAAQVPGRAGEEVGVLAQQVVDDLRGPGLGDVDRPACGRALRVGQLEVGVGGEDRAQMARGVDLGHDGEVTARGEGEDPADLGLGEVGAGDDLRVGVGGDPEALVVGEVQAQLVELQVAQLTDAVLDPGRREVLAGDVQHQPPLRLGRPVAYDALGGGAPAGHLLLEGAGAVEDAGLGGGGHGDPAAPDGEGVGLGALRRLSRVQLELDVPGAGGGGPAVRHPQLAGEQLPLVGEAAGGDDHPGRRGGPPARTPGGCVLAYGRDGAGGLGEGVDAGGGRRGGRGGRGAGRGGRGAGRSGLVRGARGAGRGDVAAGVGARVTDRPESDGHPHRTDGDKNTGPEKQPGPLPVRLPPRTPFPLRSPSPPAGHRFPPARASRIARMPRTSWIASTSEPTTPPHRDRPPYVPKLSRSGEIQTSVGQLLTTSR